MNDADFLDMIELNSNPTDAELDHLYELCFPNSPTRDLVQVARDRLDLIGYAKKMIPFRILHRPTS